MNESMHGDQELTTAGIVRRDKKLTRIVRQINESAAERPSGGPKAALDGALAETRIEDEGEECE